jgi:hypothetical protein
MLARSNEPATPPEDRFLLYLYTPDLPTLRTQLAAKGVDVGATSYPEYMPSGESCVQDPDGYRILIGHWGEQEHEAWKRRCEERHASGAIRAAAARPGAGI